MKVLKTLQKLHTQFTSPTVKFEYDQAQQDHALGFFKVLNSPCPSFLSPLPVSLFGPEKNFFQVSLFCNDGNRGHPQNDFEEKRLWRL